MTISDKNLGYLTVLVIFLIIAWLSLSMYGKSKSTVHQITLLYEDVGSLRPQDPVTKQGLVIGSVASISYENKHAKVVLSFDNPVLLRDSSKFVNYNFSLMGERRIKIISSKKGEYIKADQVIKGEFEPGISEAMHKMALVVKQVKLIREFIVLLNKGDADNPPLFEKVYRELERTESMISMMQKGFERFQPKILSVIQKTDEMTTQGIEILEKSDSIVQKVYQKTQSLVTQTHDIIEQTSTAMAAVQHKLASVENLEILQNDSLFQALSGFVVTLNKTIASIQGNGVELTDAEGNKIGLFSFSNMNIVGETAREKRARLLLEQNQ